ncbi:TetR/AcrR family transcriptional regulator [Nocardia huaxiensis]|uniref:TetR/AcrR family transcriptional regulator n=1 Tax=Nocardia huaxiensis TaxID=2755382 RepID=UPI001E40114C|nr:TetR/AcrR family transcriptional regulator [Nocardia huaxiensis]UFS98150.1 TetR/AcrR family transcriptional regulator [Nocardia huaxiensis]
MADQAPAARERMVAGAADMIRRRGLNATSVRELAKHAAAPLGSTYHYFPGGKQQLAAEAITYTGDHVAALLADYLRAGPLDGLRSFLTLWRKVVESSDFRAGCPVLAVAVEDLPDSESAPHQAAAAAFHQWTELLTASLREHGAPAGTAEATATLIVAAVEGAIAMCRAEHSTTPMDRVAGQLESLVRAATTG